MNTPNCDTGGYQARVARWMRACFTATICGDVQERCHRFYEEAGELVQALGMTREDAHMLVDYTWNRPKGNPSQEVGGVMVTLAALCLALDGVNMQHEGDVELARIWGKIDEIRRKQATKPGNHSPLPE